MNDAHLNRQHRLQYSLRGEERAFAIPQGDFDALEEVMGLCAGFWNGAGSLIVPVTRSGRVFAHLDLFLGVRGVDNCYVHEGLSDRARHGLQGRFPQAAPLYDGFDDHDIHPLHLAPKTPEGGGKRLLTIPRTETARGRRLALATWGAIPDDDLPYWHDPFEVAEAHGATAFRAMVSGQTGASPLLLSMRYMRLISQASVFDWPQVMVLDGGNFDRLVTFWNVRARSMTFGEDAPVLGLPRQAIGDRHSLLAAARWGASAEWMRRTPDFLVNAEPSLIPALDTALTDAGCERAPDPTPKRRSGPKAEPRIRPLYRYSRLGVGGGFQRGVADTVLAAFAGGKSVLALPPPKDFAVENGRHVYLTMRNLPLPFPVTPSAARRIHGNAIADEGLTILTGADSVWNFDVRLPAAWDALSDWAQDAGFQVQHSQPGRYATALLDRFGDLARLEVLADELRLRLLKLLAPESRLKLSQRLAAAVRDRRDLDERKLAEELTKRIADIGLLLEIEATTADALASALQVKLPQVLDGLAPLVEAGLVQRGRTTSCPRCNYTAFTPLAELDETVGCRSCRHDYVLPVAIQSGRREPPMTYRLDGLMARVMDQDLLPVLLTLRAVLPPEEHRDLFYAWPGLEFCRDGAPPVETDLLVSDGEHVTVSEVKSNAASLDEDQLDGLFKLAHALAAKPLIAGLSEQFDSQVAARVRGENGLILQRPELVTAA